MVKKFIAICVILFAGIAVTGGNHPDSRSNEILSIVNQDESHWQSFVYDSQIYEERVDTFRKVHFWMLVMRTSDQFMIINDAVTRDVLEIVPSVRWSRFSDEEKDDFRCALRQEHGLAEDARIFATQGKEEFYQFRKVMPTVDRGIEVFLENEVDPWYAQAILLIESPGHLVKSPDGAMGSFQLMKKVAIKYGLRVDSRVDERKDFDRSAYGAARLIEGICLPYTREMLLQRGLTFNETDLWFRLMVLHVYHAGAYNVKNALASINTDIIGMELIKQLWQTEAKGFKNASQNYTQVALASLIRLDQLIHENCVIYHSTKVPVVSRSWLPENSELAEATAKEE